MNPNQPTPTQKYNPNEIVTLTGSDGTIKQVPRSQLSQYGLSNDYISQADTFAKSVKQGTLEPNQVPQGYSAATMQALNSEGYIAPNSQQAKDKAASDKEYATVKTSFQNVLDAYKETPGFEKNMVAAGTINNLPFTRAANLEKQAKGAAAGITSALTNSKRFPSTVEVNNLIGLLPSATGGSSNNQSNVIKMDNLLKAKYSKGLDDSYLQQFGLTRDKNGKAIINNKSSFTQNATQHIDPATGLTDAQNTKNGQEIIKNIGPDLQRLGTNTINSIKQLPQIIGTGIIKAQAPGIPQVDTALPKIALNTAKSIGNTFTNQEYNRQHPVEAINNMLGVAGGAAALTKAPAEAIAESAPSAAEAAPKGSLPPIKPNPVQNLIRGATDLVNGAGSAKNIQQVTRAGTKGEVSIPQNQTLLEDGVNLHPTETGKIQAATKAMQQHGKNLENMYDNADIAFRGTKPNGTGLGDIIQKGLAEGGWNQKAIDFAKKYVSQQGNFDLNSGDNLITPKTAWQTAQKLEKNPPKNLESGETAKAFKQLSSDTARIIRQQLSNKIPETKVEAAHYSNYKDFFDNRIAQNPQGIDVSKVGSIATALPQGAKNIANSVGNALYKGAGALPKITRDMRYKQGNFTPKK